MGATHNIQKGRYVTLLQCTNTFTRPHQLHSETKQDQHDVMPCLGLKNHEQLLDCRGCARVPSPARTIRILRGIKAWPWLYPGGLPGPQPIQKFYEFYVILLLLLHHRYQLSVLEPLWASAPHLWLPLPAKAKSNYHQCPVTFTLLAWHTTINGIKWVHGHSHQKTFRGYCDAWSCMPFSSYGFI